MIALGTDILLIVAIAILVPRLMKLNKPPREEEERGVHSSAGGDDLDEILQGDWKYKGVG